MIRQVEVPKTDAPKHTGDWDTVRPSSYGYAQPDTGHVATKTELEKKIQLGFAAPKRKRRASR